MKKLFVILLAFVVVTWSLQAQDQTQTQEQTQLQEHLMLKDGKLYQVRNQEQIQLKEQLKLQNGCLVNPDGSYQLQNQKQLKLKNGECLDMSGNRYKTQQEFQQQMQIRSQSHESGTSDVPEWPDVSGSQSGESSTSGKVSRAKWRCRKS
jgi:ferredoxin-like protein FixX